MPTLESISEIESLYKGPNGSPSLGTAFTMLRTRWTEGARDRETALRLAFLVWYSCSEPSFLTGLPDDDCSPLIFSDAFSSLGGSDSTDPEVCYVFGIMAELFPFCCGNEEYWAAMGARLTERLDKLLPQGLSPAVFAGRGTYGEYFTHMASNYKRV
jgi:hypothetical protein